MNIDPTEIQGKSISLQQDEDEIWRSFKRGEEASFIYFHDKYYNELYFYALKIARDEHLAKNAIQELFLYLWKNKEKLGEVVAVKNYLFFSLRRHIYRLLKKEDQQRQFYLYSKKNEERFTFSPEDILIETETATIHKKRILKALNNLPERQREVIYLRYTNGLSNTEIAEVMDLHYQSVLNCLSRALNNLRTDILSQQNVEISLLTIALPLLLLLLCW